MKFLQPKLVVFIAAVDLSAKKYYGVKPHTTEGQVTIAGVADAEYVLMNSPKLGDEAECALIGGGCMVQAGAAFANNAELTTDANGKFVAATTGQKVVAKAWSAAAGVDEYVQAERCLYFKP